MVAFLAYQVVVAFLEVVAFREEEAFPDNSEVVVHQVLLDEVVHNLDQMEAYQTEVVLSFLVGVDPSFQVVGDLSFQVVVGLSCQVVVALCILLEDPLVLGDL